MYVNELVISTVFVLQMKQLKEKERYSDRISKTVIPTPHNCLPS